MKRSKRLFWVVAWSIFSNYVSRFITTRTTSKYMSGIRQYHCYSMVVQIRQWAHYIQHGKGAACNCVIRQRYGCNAAVAVTKINQLSGSKASLYILKQSNIANLVQTIKRGGNAVYLDVHTQTAWQTVLCVSAWYLQCCAVLIDKQCSLTSSGFLLTCMEDCVGNAYSNIKILFPTESVTGNCM